MEMKAVWCQRCANYSGFSWPCSFGHRPRYYQPKNAVSPFGFKRKCADFAAAELQPLWWILEDLRKSYEKGRQKK